MSKIIHVDVEDDLHKLLKSYAALNSITLKDAVVKAITELVDKKVPKE